MKCMTCRKDIAGGEQMRRRAEYRLVDGVTKVFGLGMPDGPLEVASGQLTGAKHNGCYHADRKRERRVSR